MFKDQQVQVDKLQYGIKKNILLHILSGHLTKYNSRN